MIDKSQEYINFCKNFDYQGFNLSHSDCSIEFLLKEAVIDMELDREFPKINFKENKIIKKG